MECISSLANQAAYCKDSLISSGSRSGYSLRISSWVIPCATRFTTKETGRRIPHHKSPAGNQQEFRSGPAMAVFFDPMGLPLATVGRLSQKGKTRKFSFLCISRFLQYTLFYSKLQAIPIAPRNYSPRKTNKSHWFILHAILGRLPCCDLCGFIPPELLDTPLDESRWAWYNHGSVLVSVR